MTTTPQAVVPGERAGRWFEVDMGLQLVGCERRRRGRLAACRDPARPRIWDRQLAIPTGPPADVAGVAAAVRGLDGWYREIGAPQWSLWCAGGETGAAWERALGAAGCERERLLLMERRTTAGELPPGVVILDGDGCYEQLLALRRALGDGGPADAVLGELVELLRLRGAAGWPPVVLAAREADELVAVMHLTVVGDLAWMEDLETRPRSRRRGHARRLLAAGDIVAHSKGARWTGYYASEVDWPWRWYRRLGFEVAGSVVRLRRLL